MQPGISPEPKLQDAMKVFKLVWLGMRVWEHPRTDEGEEAELTWKGQRSGLEGTG